MQTNKGQINIVGAIIGLGAMALTAFGFYTASNNRTDNKIGGVQQEVSGVKVEVAAVKANYGDVLRRLESIDKKLDNLLLKK